MIEQIGESEQQELCGRVRGLIRIRWLIVMASLIVIVVVNAFMPGVLPLAWLLGVVFAMLTYNVILHGFTVRVDRLGSSALKYRRCLIAAHAQIVLDLICVTLLLHFSGGLENPLLYAYVFWVVVSGILFSQGVALSYAGLASFLCCGMLILEALGIIPHYNLAGYRLPSRYAEPAHVISVSLVLTAIVFFVTYFVSSIMTQLRQRTRELMEASLSCEIRAGQLAQLNEQLQQANLSCEIRAGQLAELNERLEEMDRARTQFTLLVTHELRAPVAAIQSYLKLILEGYIPPERQREILERSEQRALEQLDLISDLLELGRIQQRAEAQAEPVQVDQVLEEIAPMMHTWANDKQVSLDVEVSAGLPPVKARSDHVKQLWVNLVSNAIKYTKPGGSVTASIRLDGDWIVGTVKDTGIGIPPEHHRHIFEEFFRTDEAKAMERHGTGLGLSIVKGVAEAYGGDIRVESEVGKGSTFTFRLPVLTEDLPDSATDTGEGSQNA